MSILKNNSPDTALLESLAGDLHKTLHREIESFLKSGDWNHIRMYEKATYSMKHRRVNKEFDIQLVESGKIEFLHLRDSVMPLALQEVYKSFTDQLYEFDPDTKIASVTWPVVRWEIRDWYQKMERKLVMEGNFYFQESQRISEIPLKTSAQQEDFFSSFPKPYSN